MLFHAWIFMIHHMPLCIYLWKQGHISAHWYTSYFPHTCVPICPFKPLFVYDMPFPSYIYVSPYACICKFPLDVPLFPLLYAYVWISMLMPCYCTIAISVLIATIYVYIHICHCSRSHPGIYVRTHGHLVPLLFGPSHHDFLLWLTRFTLFI